MKKGIFKYAGCGICYRWRVKMLGRHMVGTPVFPENTRGSEASVEPKPNEFANHHLRINFRNPHDLIIQCRAWKIHHDGVRHLVNALRTKAESVRYDEVGFAHRKNGGIDRIMVAILKDNGASVMPLGHLEQNGFYYSGFIKSELFTWDVLERATPTL